MIEYFRYTEKEITKILKSIVIVVDSREQEFLHITKWFESKKVPFEINKKLEFGDYGFKIPADPELGIIKDLHFSDRICVERKACLEELSGNFTNDRLRIETEFVRHKGKMLLLVENAEYSDIINHKYRTEYKPESFLATLHSFSERYEIPVTFMKDHNHSGYFIFYTFYYWLRNFLLHK